MRFSGFGAPLSSGFSISGLLVLALSGGLLAQSEVPDKVKMLREMAVKYQDAGQVQQAEVAYRKIMLDYEQTSYAVESQGQIVRMKLKAGDKTAAAEEYQKFLADNKNDESKLFRFNFFGDTADAKVG